MHETLIMQGRYAIEAVDARSGRVLWRRHFKNQLTNVNLTARAQMLAGTYSGDGLNIKYIALGDDSTPATPTQTQLGNELFRKQVTQIATVGAETRTLLSVGVTEALFRIREIGVFCGASASSTPGSGTMISRVVVDITHNSNIVLNIIRTDICELK